MLLKRKRAPIVFPVLLLMFGAAVLGSLYIVKTRPKATALSAPLSSSPSPLAQGGPVAQDRGQLDTALYDSLSLRLVHGKAYGGWPVKAPYPLAGALLPFKRIVAYYGNFYSKGMGVLGEAPEAETLKRLKEEVGNWQKADPGLPVLPAIHYIAVTAQGHPGEDGKYRLRMPASEIDKAMAMAQALDGILFLDVQVGWSTVQDELPRLEPYIKLPNVHLGIDPEYSMKKGQVPCSTIGTFDAADINYASAFLADIVRKYDLPPKILVVHRFNNEMVTNYKQIVTRPEVQIVMNMDGFGFPAKKIDSYKGAIAHQPVQFTGFKLFYRYDLTKGYSSIMQPRDVLGLTPAPIYIQYQ